MIFISAGHHQHKQGACFEGVCEFELAVEWADQIHAMIGGDDSIRVPNGTLANKVAFINQRTPDLAIEIHFNSAKLWKDLNANGQVDDGEMVNVGRGSETLYYPGSKKGKVAAEFVQSALGALLPPNRGAKEGWYQMNRDKGPDFFLAKTRCTSLIIEPEFIDNLDTLHKNKEAACGIIAATLIKLTEGILSDGTTE